MIQNEYNQNQRNEFERVKRKTMLDIDRRIDTAMDHGFILTTCILLFSDYRFMLTYVMIYCTIRVLKSSIEVYFINRNFNKYQEIYFEKIKTTSKEPSRKPTPPPSQLIKEGQDPRIKIDD